MIKTIKRPISILLAVLMVIGMFSALPISAGAATWTFKLNSNFSGAWNANTDVESNQPIELTLAEGDYEFQIVAYEDGNLRSYRGNEQAGSFTENYSQTMHDNGGNAKFHADGGKYTLTYNAGSGVLTINPVYVAEIDGTNYKTLEAAFAAAQDGDTIKVLADSTGNGIVVPQGKFNTNGLTVDFNGHTYTVNANTVGSTGTETNGFQLLKDNKITFTNGTITSEKAKILVQNYSDLTLDGMTLTLNNPNYTSAYTLSNNNGNIVIDGTTINANPAGGFAFDVCRFSSYPSVNVKVTGNSTINGNVEISASKGDAKDGFSLTLESGNMNGDIVVDASAQALVGEDNKVTKADTFTQEAPEGFKWNDSGVLVPVQYVAEIGTTKYETLEAAFAAAQDGNTITLLANCAGNGIVAPQGKFATGLTVDFAGFTYTVDGETVGSTGTETNGFQLLKDNKITFTNGTITSAKAKILVQNYSDLTLDNMTLTLDNPNYTSAYTLSNNNGDVVIKDTTINANPAGGFAFDVCRYASYPSVHVTVTGNSQINGNVEVYASGSDAKDGFSLTLESGAMTGNIVLDQTAKNVIAATPNKAVISKEATFEKAAPADYKWNDSGVLVPVDYVAQIGTTKYETLEAAFAAAKDGETITVLTDCAGNGIKAPQGKFATGLTVDFAGHTYTVSGTPVGSTGTETIGFQLLKDNKITFKGGTITGNSNENTDLQRMIQNYSDLTLENMTVSMVGRYYDQITVSTCNGKTVIKDSTISAPDYSWANINDPATVRAAALTVGTFSSYPSIDVTVEGTSVINGDVNVSDDNNKKAFSLKLNGGELNGKINLDENAKAAINDTASTANVTKADTFTQEAPADFRWVDNGNGTSTLAPIPYVAQIGSTKYETLEAAFAAAKDGETITVLTDCAGNGIKAPQGKFATGLTVDFAGHTYTVSGTPVGSTGTETIGFQLLKDNKITFKGGTITGNSNENTDLQRMIQNYSDLTLDNMTVSMVGRYYDQITVSTCNGKTVIKDSTISAPDYTWAHITDPASVRAAALTVGTFSSYPSIDVTVEGTSVINGDVNVSDDNNKKAFSLKLNGGELNGNINLDENAKAAINDTASTANVTKADTFTQAAPEDYRWVDNGNGTSTLAPIPYVAKIGETKKYETLEAAFAAANDGETITLLADCAGNGIKAPQGKFTTGLTVDFAGHTYTVDGETVGSTGTETNGFQLLKDNKITFQNGTITSAKAKILVQNYSNLTLDKMTLTLNNPNYTSAYTLSNNNGNIVIDDTTINANQAGGFAFDVCRYASYPSVNVTVTGNSQINGDVEIFASNGQAKEGFSLTLESGAMTGNIVVDASAQALVGETNKVTKADTFTKTAPAGFEWVSNGDGTSTLAKVQDLFPGHSITLNGNINLNFYINTKAIPGYANASSVKATFTWDSKAIASDNHYGDDVVVVELKDLTPDANGWVKAYVPVNAAQMANQIEAKVYVGDGEALAETDTYSVMQYAKELLAGNYTDAQKTLVKKMLNYGAMAQKVFESQLVDSPDASANSVLSENDRSAIAAEMNNVTSAKIIEAVETTNGHHGATIDDLRAIGTAIGGKWYTTSVIFLDGNTIRHYFDDVNDTQHWDNADGVQDEYFYYVKKDNIAAANLDKLYTFSIGSETFEYSVLDYAAAVVNSGMDDDAKDLAKALYLYNQAANACFGN